MISRRSVELRRQLLSRRWGDSSLVELGILFTNSMISVYGWMDDDVFGLPEVDFIFEVILVSLWIGLFVNGCEDIDHLKLLVTTSEVVMNNK